VICEWLQVPGVGSVHVCRQARRKPKCKGCGAAAERLCDWKTGKGKTCDAPVCSSCSVSPEPEKDLCPVHAGTFRRWLVWKAKRAAATT
jgi:hypothetical protein